MINEEELISVLKPLELIPKGSAKYSLSNGLFYYVVERNTKYERNGKTGNWFLRLGNVELFKSKSLTDIIAFANIHYKHSIPDLFDLTKQYSSCHNP